MLNQLIAHLAFGAYVPNTAASVDRAQCRAAEEHLNSNGIEVTMRVIDDDDDTTTLSGEDKYRYSAANPAAWSDNTDKHILQRVVSIDLTFDRRDADAYNTILALVDAAAGLPVADRLFSDVDLYADRLVLRCYLMYTGKGLRAYSETITYQEYDKRTGRVSAIGVDCLEKVIDGITPDSEVGELYGADHEVAVPLSQWAPPNVELHTPVAVLMLRNKLDNSQQLWR